MSTTQEPCCGLGLSTSPIADNEILSSESLVRRCFQFVKCVETSFDSLALYEVYGDGSLVGASRLGPTFAWIDAAQNLPYQFLQGFETKRPPSAYNFPDALRVYYRLKKGQDEACGQK